MSEFKEIKNSLQDINRGINEAIADDWQPTIRFNGRPDLRVIEFDPLAYEKYGRFFGRGPNLCGSFAVRTLMWAEATVDDTRFISDIDIVIEAADEFYGVSVGRRADVINNIANQVVPESGINLTVEEFDPIFM